MVKPQTNTSINRVNEIGNAQPPQWEWNLEYNYNNLTRNSFNSHFDINDRQLISEYGLWVCNMLTSDLFEGCIVSEDVIIDEGVTSVEEDMPSQ
jgi:hypothetical protein